MYFWSKLVAENQDPRGKSELEAGEDGCPSSGDWTLPSAPFGSMQALDGLDEALNGLDEAPTLGRTVCSADRHV